MKTRLLVFRELLKRFSIDDEKKVLTHALGLSSLVYFSTPFIKKTLDKLGYGYRILEDQGMLCLVVETGKEVYISFRGTMPSKLSNWKKILNFWPKKFINNLKAHGGFVLYHRQYESFVKEYIDSIDHKNKEIIFTGHSLGAAISALYNISYTNSSKCISFASPNILYNSSFISNFSKVYRIRKDFITWIPIKLLGINWSIPSTPIHIKSKYNGFNPFKYHSLSNYIESLLNLT